MIYAAGTSGQGSRRGQASGLVVADSLGQPLKRERFADPEPTPGVAARTRTRRSC